VNKNIKVTYFFVSGRKNRINSGEEYSKEFFYSYPDIKEKFNNTEIIEFNDVQKISTFLNNCLKFLDKLIRKLTKLPFFMSEIINLTNLKKIINSDILIATNDRIGLSIVPILLFKKITLKKFMSTNVFVLGLFSNLSNDLTIKALQKIILNIYFRLFDNFIFIGKSEYEYALNYSPKYKDKFIYIPFGIDTNFWVPPLEDTKKNDYVLFIGNDGYRDFKKVIDIANQLPEIEFVFISKQINEEELTGSNVKLLKGHWNYNVLTDQELREIYHKAKLTIIPLIDSLQPSGQSVALQSISCGTPVLISDTSGFWDRDKFYNEKNIFFMDNNSLDSWIIKIKHLLDNNKKLKDVSINGIKSVHSELNLENFNNKLFEVIGIYGNFGNKE
jgi:glycosyltransferase involved in cell wall biosynthesis